MIPVAIIGLGGAGGSLADEASKQGFHAGAINFSQKDLDSLVHIDESLKLKVIGSEGVGQDRGTALKLISNHHEMVAAFLEENFSSPSIEVIIFSFSTGGGSGSGISPALLDYMSSKMDKIFVAMPILPDLSEVVGIQSNSTDAFEELSKLQLCILPVDNNQVKSFHPNIGKNKLYEIANQSVVSLLYKVISYTEKHSKNGNFDRTDFLKVLNTKGLATIAETDFATINTNLSADGIANAINESWIKSVFVPIEFDQVVKAGVIFDGQEHFMEYLNNDKIFSKFKNGKPLYLFEGNYHENNGKIITILSGLSWCKTRLNQIENLIEEAKAKAQNSMVNLDNQAYQSKAKLDFVKNTEPKKEVKKSFTDFVNKIQGR